MAKDFGLAWGDAGGAALVGDNFLAVRSGYLRKSPAETAPGAGAGLTYRLKVMKRWERRWFVFGVRNGSTPYMEYFESETSPANDPPINSISLSSCHSVTSHLFDKKYENTFCLHLGDRVLTLVAASPIDMEEWCAAICDKLTELGILESRVSPQENPYVIDDSLPASEPSGALPNGVAAAENPSPPTPLPRGASIAPLTRRNTAIGAATVPKRVAEGTAVAAAGSVAPRSAAAGSAATGAVPRGRPLPKTPTDDNVYEEVGKKLPVLVSRTGRARSTRSSRDPLPERPSRPAAPIPTTTSESFSHHNNNDNNLVSSLPSIPARLSRPANRDFCDDGEPIFDSVFIGTPPPPGAGNDSSPGTAVERAHDPAIVDPSNFSAQETNSSAQQTNSSAQETNSSAQETNSSAHQTSQDSFPPYSQPLPSRLRSNASAATPIAETAASTTQPTPQSSLRSIQVPRPSIRRGLDRPSSPHPPAFDPLPPPPETKWPDASQDVPVADLIDFSTPIDPTPISGLVSGSKKMTDGELFLSLMTSGFDGEALAPSEDDDDDDDEEETFERMERPLSLKRAYAFGAEAVKTATTSSDVGSRDNPRLVDDDDDDDDDETFKIARPALPALPSKSSSLERRATVLGLSQATPIPDSSIESTRLASKGSSPGRRSVISPPPSVSGSRVTIEFTSQEHLPILVEKTTTMRPAPRKDRPPAAGPAPVAHEVSEADYDLSWRAFDSPAPTDGEAPPPYSKEAEAPPPYAADDPQVSVANQTSDHNSNDYDLDDEAPPPYQKYSDTYHLSLEKKKNVSKAGVSKSDPPVEDKSSNVYVELPFMRNTLDHFESRGAESPAGAAAAAYPTPPDRSPGGDKPVQPSGNTEQFRLGRLTLPGLKADESSSDSDEDGGHGTGQGHGQGHGQGSASEFYKSPVSNGFPTPPATLPPETLMASGGTTPSNKENELPAPEPIEGGSRYIWTRRPEESALGTLQKVKPGNQQPPMSLRQSQVALLRREMAHSAGVKVALRHKDAHRGVALIDFLDRVWVSGWKQRDHPNLHNAFHIGDMILSINALPVGNAASAQKMIKHCRTDTIELVVHRMPHAKAVMIKRTHEGESIGIVRDGNSADIVSIESGGLMDHAGVPASTPWPTPTCATATSAWTLTEINARHLNLFPKENEIRDRLNSVGREISLVVQPTEFVKILRRGIKKMSNFKDYIVQ